MIHLCVKVRRNNNIMRARERVFSGKKTRLHVYPTDSITPRASSSSWRWCNKSFSEENLKFNVKEKSVSEGKLFCCICCFSFPSKRENRLESFLFVYASCLANCDWRKGKSVLLWDFNCLICKRLQVEGNCVIKRENFQSPFNCDAKKVKKN